MKTTSHQFLVFLAAGCVSTLVTFTSRIFYNLVIEFSAAVIVAHLTGMITLFFLARRFVFRSSSHGWRTSFLYFSLVNLVSVAQTWGVSIALAYYVLPWLNIESFRFEIAHMTGLITTAFTSFVGHKYFSFR